MAGLVVESLTKKRQPQIARAAFLITQNKGLDSGFVNRI